MKLRKLKQDADKKKAAEVEAEKKGIAVTGSTSAGELVLQKEVGSLSCAGLAAALPDIVLARGAEPRRCAAGGRAA